ncbi:MAG: hypothetical protein DRG39_00635 [Deltaproteobacteria bacterium]|nr:MAG: hypothetical protein DRG39_00635 [Deltaproteobacteria bacterium]
MGTDLSRSYSDYWRRNLSSIESRELVYLLKALKKVARHVSSRVKPIEWKGISVFDEGKIVLDLSYVLGEYPVPPVKVDALVGWVVHETLHVREMSSFVLYKARGYSKGFPMAQKRIFLQMIEAGEDIYVNHVAKGSIWEFYLNRAWKDYYPRIRRDKDSIISILFDIWRKTFFQEGFRPPLGLSPLKGALDLLQDFGHRLLAISKEKSVMEKALQRFSLYQEMWSSIYPLVRDWERSLITDFPDLDATDMYKDEESGSGSDEPDISLPRRDIEQLKEMLVEQEEDLTSQIRAMVKDGSSVMPTFFWEEDIPCDIMPDPGTVKKIRAVFESQRQKSRRFLHSVNRGLPFGKIDSRRLHRLFIDGRLFKEKEYEHRHYWNIVILVDASISMSINKNKADADNWYNVQKAFSSLYEAAKGYRNIIQLYAYYEQAGRCFVSNLLKNNRLYTLSPRGKTPSGQAIMAIALNMNKGHRKKDLLIHITDGESNCGIDVSEAIRYCERKGIRMITIGCGYNEQIRDYLSKTYKNIYFMKDFQELPEALENLLRKTLT